MKALVHRLQELGIDSFWHFTPVKNVSSIQKFGLIPLNDLERLWESHAIESFERASTDLSVELDRRKKLDQYVHLSFTDKHPMYWRLRYQKRSLVWIKVSLDILYDNEVLFSPEVANASGARLYKPDQLLDYLRDCTKYDCKRRLKKAELLVQGNIRPDYLEFVDDSDNIIEIS